MKVAIFENEFEEMRPAFNGFNLLYHQKSINFSIYPSSQALASLKDLNNFDYVLIDIDLSIKSTLDGFQLIEEMLKDKDVKNVKPIILTGQPPVKEKLKAKNLPEFPIIVKPLIYTQIQDSFMKAKPLETYRKR